MQKANSRRLRGARHTRLVLTDWLQGGSEGGIGDSSLPLAACMALAGLVGGVGLVALPPLLLALQQASPLLEDLVLKSANDADEVLHMDQIHLQNTAAAMIHCSLLSMRYNR